MNSPYTNQPLDALMAAQTSVGLLLGAFVWRIRLRPWLATVLLLSAVAIAVVVPVDGSFWAGLGASVGQDHTKHALRLAAALAALATLLTRRARLIVIAVIGEISLWAVTDFIQDCDWELAGAHLALFGLVAGIYWRMSPGTVATESPGPPGPAPRWPAWADDVAAFGIGAVAGAIVSRVVLRGWTNSGDEWADTFQAALFAKLHAYGTVPRCAEAFRSFWVFQYLGRSFAMYTPGWPYFMTPFVALRVPWLAGPASLGLLAAGVSRLGRRAAAGFAPGDGPPAEARVRAAGRLAVLATLLGSTMLINGGSRYPHVFVAATYAWSVESMLAMATNRLSRREEWLWGATLGGSASLMVATRPGDGAMLGIGLFLYFVYAVVRRRVTLGAVACAAATFGLIGGLTLVILRLQVGRWFATGYAINALVYPWNKFAWSLPRPNEYKWGVPLAMGAYCWWPCSPAVGLAGVAALRGRAQRIAFVFFLGYAPFVVFYTLLEVGRGFDFGYGPRYLLPCVVPMAVGTGVVLAELWTAARSVQGGVSAFDAGGPATLALAAVALGVVRIAPLVYPFTYADVQNHNRLHEALERTPVHNAVVFGGPGLTNTDPMDLTENLPLELYPDQDLLIAVDRGPEAVKCVRESYPQRTFYRALPEFPVRIVPY